MSQPVLVVITVPDQTAADDIASALVERRLAAGVQQTVIKSTYWWDNAIQNEPEIVLTVKTIDDRFDAIERTVDELHPYDVPPLIMLPIARGKASYLDWIAESVS